MYFDRKGVPGVMAYPTARLILATNHEPRFADRSKGIWRRMMVIPFRVGIPIERQDKKLVQKLKAELPGIFNWSVDGLRALRHQGSFTVPAISQQLWAELKAQSNYTRQFLVETCEPGAGQSLSCTALYARYEEWCRDRTFKVLDDTQFGKELRKAFPNVDRQRDGTGERPWRYVGLRIVGQNQTKPEEVTRG
jgi:putative DNA primase/helicase